MRKLVLTKTKVETNVEVEEGTKVEKYVPTENAFFKLTHVKHVEATV